MSWMSWTPARLIRKWLNSASESLRTSKKTLGMESDSRIPFRVWPLAPAVENALSPRVWMSIKYVRLSGEKCTWRMDTEPCRERLTPSRSMYNDGGLVGRLAMASIRSATAVHVSTRPVGRVSLRLLFWSESTRADTSRSWTVAIATTELLMEKGMSRKGIGRVAESTSSDWLTTVPQKFLRRVGRFPTTGENHRHAE